MNVERLKAVADGILNDPKSYNQNYFFKKVLDQGAPCGTTECICGRAIVQFDPEGLALEKKWISLDATLDAGNLWEKGKKILDLTEEQARLLFSEVEESVFEEGEDSEEFYNDYCKDGWPFEYAYAYYTATSGEERAKIAAARIDAFIASEGTI